MKLVHYPSITCQLAASWLRVVLLLSATLSTTTANAAHPLITEDTGTQGKGGWQLEINAEQTRDYVDGATVRGLQPAATLTYGVLDNLDLQINQPYLRQKSDNTVVSGKLDTLLDAKWRFYENGPLSFALEPQITLPTGREDQGLGTGKANWGSLLIMSYEPEGWAFHSHVGYLHNRNTIGLRQDLKHISGAFWLKPTKQLNLVLDRSYDTNPDMASNEALRQTVVGVIYSVTPELDLDAGFRRGNAPAIDRAVLFGVTLRW